VVVEAAAATRALGALVQGQVLWGVMSQLPPANP